MPLPYLKDLIPVGSQANVAPRKFWKEVDNRFQPGEKQYVWVFGTAQGQEAIIYAYPNEHAYFKNLSLGQWVPVTRGEKKLIWPGMQNMQPVLMPAGPAVTYPAQPPPPQQQYEQQPSPNYVNDGPEPSLTHDYKLGLAGIVQAQLVSQRPVLTAEFITDGELKGDPSAAQWVKWIRKKAKELAWEETIDELGKL